MAAPMQKPVVVGSTHGGALELHRGITFGEVSSTQPPFKNGVNRKLSRSGIGHAINKIPLGVAANFPERTQRGGPRKLADRVSHGLSKAHIANLKAAEAYSRSIGLPFTRMITIHWQAAGVPLEGMARATGRFLDLLSKAISRHGGRAAYVWMHENGDGKGGHCHILTHVPPDLVPTLTGLQKGWLRKITGQPYRKRVIHSDPIGGRLGLETGNPELHLVNVKAALAYILKGATPDAAATHGLGRCNEGGRIIGKRCGASQNIGYSARHRHR